MCHRTTVLTWLVLVLALCISGCTQPQEQSQAEPPSFSAEDTAAVRANLDTFMTADPIDEPATFFPLFTEDVYWNFADNGPVEGMEALKAVTWCHTLSSEMPADRVEGSGDLAYARGTYRLSLGCGQDAPVEREGTFLSVHRRQQDGTWRIESMLAPN